MRSGWDGEEEEGSLGSVSSMLLAHFHPIYLPYLTSPSSTYVLTPRFHLFFFFASRSNHNIKAPWLGARVWVLI